MTEKEWDKKLKIDTCGRLDGHADEYHHPYEPTPYSVLERLVESDYITKNSRILDYGCGKGRVGFFLHYKLGCSVTGIEYDKKIYAKVQENQRSYTGIGKCARKDDVTDGEERNRKGVVECICADAKDYRVKDADCFYFFNPFSLEILQSVLGKILDSYYEKPRSMQLFFYYPADEYVAYLMTEDELMFVDEIDCSDLFEEQNQRERILIFEVV